MSDVPFYRTQMGHRFYEATAPSLVRELARLNDNLERLVALAARVTKADEQPPTDVKPEEPR
jgi:hypothetical protein